MYQHAPKPYEKLQLQDDFMFSKIMHDPKYCKPFLETILGIRIKKLVYAEPQKSIDMAVGAKSIRLDVYVEDEAQTVFDLEMQPSVKKNLPKRTRYYQGMIDLNILEKGEDYQKLRKSFIIFICTYDPFSQGRHIYTFENRCTQDPQLTLGDDAIKIILNTKGTANDISPELKRLLDYIDGKDASDSFTRDLDDAVLSARRNERWRLDYMTLQQEYREKFEEGHTVGLQEGRKEGRQEGLLEGRQEGIIATITILRNLQLNDEQILVQIMTQYHLSEEEAKKFL